MEWGRDSDPLLSNDVLRDSLTRLARRCGTARSTELKKGKCVRRPISARRIRSSLGDSPHVSKLCRPARILAVPLESDASACGEGHDPAGWRGARSDSANCLPFPPILLPSTGSSFHSILRPRQSSADLTIFSYPGQKRNLLCGVVFRVRVGRRVSACPLRIFILPWDGLYHHGAVGCGCDGGECAVPVGCWRDGPGYPGTLLARDPFARAGVGVRPRVRDGGGRRDSAQLVACMETQRGVARDVDVFGCDSAGLRGRAASTRGEVAERVEVNGSVRADLRVGVRDVGVCEMSRGGHGGGLARRRWGWGSLGARRWRSEHGKVAIAAWCPWSAFPRVGNAGGRAEVESGE
ncbi:hypothetical protein B0H13DRAFT_1905983 [Mycena leptocephala]|nr:hypothetical protein B0H13DRAFT_1905983 [Mycena leptocephala]